MRFFFMCFSFLCLWTFSAVAQESPRPVHFLLAAGSEFRSDKDAEGNFVGQNLSNLGIGFGYQNFVFLIEQSQFQDGSGNSTLSIQHTFQDDLLWAQWRATSWNWVVPFVAAGVGVYREKIETQLSGTTMSNQSKDKFLSGLGFGVGSDLPYLWLSVEIRLFAGDELDPQPTLGGLARLGVWF